MGKETRYQFLVRTIAVVSSDCLIWPYATDTSGYGKLFHEGKYFSSHRLSLTLKKGPAPKHQPIACHGPCNNRLCYNPYHLYWGSRAQNELDKIRDGTATLGERNPATQLSDETVMMIYVDERAPKIIAQVYGASVEVVRNIKAKRSWVHVTQTLEE